MPAGASDVHLIGACVRPDDGISQYAWCQVEWKGQAGWTSANGIQAEVINGGSELQSAVTPPEPSSPVNASEPEVDAGPQRIWGSEECNKELKRIRLQEAELAGMDINAPNKCQAQGIEYKIKRDYTTWISHCIDGEGRALKAAEAEKEEIAAGRTFKMYPCCGRSDGSGSNGMSGFSLGRC